jgi:hypothetical protein
LRKCGLKLRMPTFAVVYVVVYFIEYVFFIVIVYVKICTVLVRLAFLFEKYLKEYTIMSYASINICISMPC